MFQHYALSLRALTCALLGSAQGLQQRLHGVLPHLLLPGGGGPARAVHWVALSCSLQPNGFQLDGSVMHLGRRRRKSLLCSRCSRVSALPGVVLRHDIATCSLTWPHIHQSPTSLCAEGELVG